jgi:hypothetical protein
MVRRIHAYTAEGRGTKIITQEGERCIDEVGETSSGVRETKDEASMRGKEQGVEPKQVRMTESTDRSGLWYERHLPLW